MGQPNHDGRDLSGFTEEDGFPPPPLGAKVIRSSLTSHTTNIIIRSMTLDLHIDHALLFLTLQRGDVNPLVVVQLSFKASPCHRHGRLALQ